jgi:hypothetical protein
MNTTRTGCNKTAARDFTTNSTLYLIYRNVNYRVSNSSVINQLYFNITQMEFKQKFKLRVNFQKYLIFLIKSLENVIQRVIENLCIW